MSLPQGECSHCNNRDSLRVSTFRHKVCIVCIRPNRTILKDICEACVKLFKDCCDNCLIKYESEELIPNPAHPEHKLCPLCIGALPNFQDPDSCKKCFSLHSHNFSSKPFNPNLCILCKTSSSPESFVAVTIRFVRTV